MLAHGDLSPRIELVRRCWFVFFFITAGLTVVLCNCIKNVHIIPAYEQQMAYFSQSQEDGGGGMGGGGGDGIVVVEVELLKEH